MNSVGVTSISNPIGKGFLQRGSAALLVKSPNLRVKTLSSGLFADYKIMRTAQSRNGHIIPAFFLEVAEWHLVNRFSAVG